MESSCLHFDLVFEILSRTSTDTLARCRLASKKWNLMTYEPKFKKCHAQNTNIVDGFFVNKVCRYRNVTSFVSVGYKTHEISLHWILGSHVCMIAVAENSGIILCTLDNPRQYYVPHFYVCKPATKQSQQIPNPRTRFSALGTGMAVIGTNPFRYKILKISTPKSFVRHRQQLLLEMFDSEAWKWKILKDVLLPLFVWFLCVQTVVESSGAFHCLLHKNLILSIDIEKEDLKITNLPLVEEDYRRIDMAKYEGKLALMCINMDDYMHVWVLENYVNMVWNKRFTVNMTAHESMYMSHTTLRFYGLNIVVVKDNDKSLLKYYDIKDEKFLLESSELKTYYTTLKIFPFWSDLKPCCLRQGRRYDILMEH